MDLERGSLTCRGREIPLRPKSFSVLQYLLEHAGELISREDLLDAVWPGLVVTDDSVTQCLLELRRALGDTDRTIIRTIPRRGVVLDVPVRFEDPAAVTAPHEPRRVGRHVWMLGIGLVSIVAAFSWWLLLQPRGAGQETAISPQPASSIAVLRFTDMSPGEDQAYLADGLSEDITHQLAQSPDLTVIARTSAFAVDGEAVDIIAQRLNVSHVLEGSVRKRGNEFRVSAQLIDARTSAHIWSKSFDRGMSGIFEVQRDIAEAVADELEVNLPASDFPTEVDPIAYELFLEGRFLYHRRLEGDRVKAQERLEQALAISPGFAEAWALLAAVMAARLHDQPASRAPGIDRERLEDKHRHAIEQALQFGPNLPEAHHRAAQYYYLNGAMERTREHMDIVQSLDPDHFAIRNAVINELRQLGRIDEANAQLRRQIRRDPLNFSNRGNYVKYLLLARQLENARAELVRLRELMPTIAAESDHLRVTVGNLLFHEADYAAAAATLETMPHGMERLRLDALVQHALGRKPESGAALAELAVKSGDGFGALYVAEVHAWRGEAAESLDWLERVNYPKQCSAVVLAENVYYSPLLASLDGNPKWAKFRADAFQVMKDCTLGLDVDSAVRRVVPGSIEAGS